MHNLKLVKKAKSNDIEAFEELLTLHSEQLYRTAFLYVGNREDALDIVQETSYKAFLAIKTLKKNKYFSTWLTKILINTAYEFLNKRKREVPLENIDQYLAKQDEFNVEQIDLLRAVNNLKGTYRDAIILFYFRDLPIKEIAIIMGVPENTVKTYLHRGKEQLKKKLKEAELSEGKILSGFI
ncbi:sigma-70 family RNA polymerase sigma factor [Ornithinibacillus halotolerans]|uniref:DNA-directed RNA polymerase sigma-70 factor n=1 Tax=Ornithinibacillus halotolerans TaxID=1274357 RepID=A0A916WD23_9BACI|nr:sigma-70 family RNA polymerase sigma factor [Ornithinibacillus halotolerans]GGA89844.1 DNA-directed RNA polymerase sigma-70 factor [Ornithinibacillus halotolerans]